MKIAISAAGPSLDAEIHPHFGRCRHFIVLDLWTLDFEAVEHAGIAATRGAGIATAQMLINSGAQVVLTGECGSNAYDRLTEAGIQLITGVSGKIRDAVEAYKAGRLQPASEATASVHPSLGGGRGGGARPDVSRRATIPDYGSGAGIRGAQGRVADARAAIQ